MLNVSFKTEKLGAVSRNELPPSLSNVSLLSTQGKKKQKNPKERNWRESTRRTNDRSNRFVQRKHRHARQVWKCGSVKTTIHDDNRALQGQCDPTRSAICRSTAPIHRSKRQSYSSQKLQHPSLMFASRACCSARGSSSSTTHSHQRFLPNARSPIDTSERNQANLVGALLRLPGYGHPEQNKSNDLNDVS